MAKTSSVFLPCPVPVNLITGLLGSGKTTAIRHLIAQKPEDDSWGILINEFGEIGIDEASLPQQETLTTLEVSGGCICCSAQFGLIQALNALLDVQKDGRPLDRILIEPTGLGHPAKVIDVLQQGGFSCPIQLAQIICLITPAQLTQVRWQKSAVMRDIVTLSDCIFLNKIDQACPEEIDASKQLLEGLYPSKTRVFSTQFSQIPLGQLIEPHQNQPLLFLSGEAEHESETVCQSQAYVSILPEVRRCEVQVGALTGTIGWVFSADVQFNRTQLRKLTEKTAGGSSDEFHQNAVWGHLIRAKGLLRTGREWMLVNWSAGQFTFEDIAWRQDNRLELIFSLEDSQIDFKAIEEGLYACLNVRS